MEKIKIEKNGTSLVKIELNDMGDYVAISADSQNLFDKFAAGFKHIADLADELPKKLAEIEKKYADRTDFNAVMDKTIESSKESVKFSEEAVNVIDSIFGEGTVKKFFRNVYEEIPDFLPDAECIIDFFEKISPIMEDLFNRKIEGYKKASQERMARYVPQDHKKASRKK